MKNLQYHINTKALLRLAVVNNRITEEQAKFLKYQYKKEKNFTKNYNK